MNAESTNVTNNAYRCEPCEMDMAVGNINTHLNGKRHRNRCAVLATLEESKLHIPPASNPDTIPPTGYCGFCKKSYTDGIEKHMTSIEHLTAVKRATQAIHGSTPPSSEFHQNAVPPLEPPPAAIEPSVPLPMLVAEWVCEVCEISCHINTRETHLASKKHVKKAGLMDAARKLREMLTPVAVNSGAGGGGEDLASAAAPVLLTDWFCEICEKHCHISTREAHLGSKKHIMMVCGVPPVPIAAAIIEDPVPTTMLVSDWFCEICEKHCHISTREAHLGSKKHIKKVGGVAPVPIAAIIEEPVPTTMLVSDWFCEVCERDYHINTRETHLGSKKHIKKAKLTQAAQNLREMLTPVGMPSVDLPQPNTRSEETPRNDPWIEKPLVHKTGTENHDCVSYCDVCGEKIKFNLGSWNVSPGIYCGICQMMVHANCLDTHLARTSHRKPRSGVTPTVVPTLDVRESTTSAAEDTPDDKAYCTLRDPALSRKAKDLRSKMNGALVQAVTVEGEPVDGKKDSEDTSEEEEGDDGGDFDKLNMLVRRQALKKESPEPRAASDTEIEIWNCALCVMDMHPTMRKAHEARPFHMLLLEQKKLEVGGLTERQSTPVNPRVPLFRCHICLTTYGPNERYLHASPPWHCEVCDTIVHTSSKANHLFSVRHQLKESAPGQNYTAPAFTPASTDTFFCLPCRSNFLKSERKFHHSPPYYCALCEMVMHADTRDIHEWSLSHSRAVDAATTRPAKSSERFSCQTCGDNFPIAVQPFHRSRAWACELCEERVHMDWIGAHLLSEKHVAREKDEAAKGVVDGPGVEPVKRVRKKRVKYPKAVSTGNFGEGE